MTMPEPTAHGAGLSGEDFEIEANRGAAIQAAWNDYAAHHAVDYAGGFGQILFAAGWLACDAYQDAYDIAEAERVEADIAEHGTVPWETVEAGLSGAAAHVAEWNRLVQTGELPDDLRVRAYFFGRCGYAEILTERIAALEAALMPFVEAVALGQYVGYVNDYEVEPLVTVGDIRRAYAVLPVQREPR